MIKQLYERPAMEVVELKMNSRMLLQGSPDADLNVVIEEETI